MPAILRDTLIFPYTTGLGPTSKQLRAGRLGRGRRRSTTGCRTRPSRSSTPRSTRERGAGRGRRSRPTSPSELGTGWTVPLQDTFGEFQIGIWLREAGVREPAARDAAAGWGGDRLAVIEGPDGAWAVAWQTDWDTEADAAAFETAATTALGKARGVGKVLPGDGRHDPLGRRRKGRRDASKVAGRRLRLARPGRVRPAASPTSSRARRSRGAPSAFASVTCVGLGEREPRGRSLGLVRVDDPRVAIEPVERRRELGRVGGDAVRLLGGDGVLDDFGEADDGPRQRGLGRAGERARRRRPPATARRPPPCAGSTRSARARTARSRRGSRSTASWPARCRSRWRSCAPREAKNQRAASTPTSASSSSSVMNSPARLLIETSTPSRTKRTHE